MQDLISRQAAIDAVGKYLKKDGDVITIADVVDAAVAIGMLPSAEPERTCEYWDSESKFCALCRPSAEPEWKKGRWCKAYADIELHGIRPFIRVCSSCASVSNDYYNYCPNCGADMRGEEDGQG